MQYMHSATISQIYCYFVGDIKGTACPVHKSRNIARAVCVILTVQYQQKPSADTVKSQCTARCWPQSNNKPFNVGEIVLYVIYGTRVP